MDPVEIPELDDEVRTKFLESERKEKEFNVNHHGRYFHPEQKWYFLENHNLDENTGQEAFNFLSQEVRAEKVARLSFKIHKAD
jgi:hypothetical protein